MDSPPRPPALAVGERELGRRAVLRAGLAALAGLGGVGLLAGCGIDVRDLRWDPSLGAVRPEPAPTPGPDELARRRAVASARTLEALCSTAARTWPQAAPVLTLVARQDAQHLAALGAAASQTSSSSPSATGTGPGTPADLVAEHTAAATQALADTGTTSGPLARLLTQVGAARAVQARQVAAALGVAQPPDPKAPASRPRTPAPSASSATPTAGSSSRASSSGASSPGAASVSASPSPDLRLRKQVLDALTAALRGEQAAVYGYEALAVRLAGGARDQATAAIGGHQDVADLLGALLRRAGKEPPSPAPGYRLPGPVQTPEQATALAAEIESSLAEADGDLVAATDGDGSEGEVRAVAVQLVVQRALAASAWGAPPTAFPGG
ncbi:MAG: ferritin-like domain-containing protein [Actinomycetes bacterium]